MSYISCTKLTLLDVGLLEARVRESLNVLKPDFIYVHLGINDSIQKKKCSDITANYAAFSLRISDDLPGHILFDHSHRQI